MGEVGHQQCLPRNTRPTTNNNKHTRSTTTTAEVGVCIEAVSESGAAEVVSTLDKYQAHN